MVNTSRLFLLLFFLITSSVVVGQTTDELEGERKNLIRQIEITNNILNETRQNQKATLDEYLALEKRVDNRSRLIHTIQDEIQSNQDDILNGRESIITLNSEIETLKSDFGVILRSAYRQKVTRNSLIYILSSQSLQQAFLRWRYTAQFENYAQKKAKLIKDKLSELENTIQDIEQGQQDRETLLKEEQIQNLHLRDELNNKNTLLSALQKDQERLLQELEEKNNQREQLDQVISGIVLEDRSPDVPSRNEPESEIEVSNSSVNFEDYKGKMPWPVEEGFVVSSFGRRKHPALPHIQITNNGVDIRAELRSEVYAVIDGQVSGQAFIPGYNNMLVIKHGTYRTVYAKLDKIYVQKGEFVKSGQLLGQLAVEENISEVHFEIWLGDRKMNPEDWLEKK